MSIRKIICICLLFFILASLHSQEALKSIEEADLILLVIDALNGLDEEDIKLIELTKNKKRIIKI